MRSSSVPHSVAQDGDLVPRYLLPAGVGADNRDGGEAAADVGVEFGQAVGAGTVAVEEPYLCVGAYRGGADREAATHTQGAEDARIEPAQGAARPYDVSGRGHEVAAVDDEDAVVIDLLFDALEQVDGIHQRAFAVGRGGDLRVALVFPCAQGFEPIVPLGCGVGFGHQLDGQLHQEVPRMGLHGAGGTAIFL